MTALLLAILFTLSTYILQANLNYPEILTEKASPTLSHFIRRMTAAPSGFVGLLLCGILLLVLSLSLAQQSEKRFRTNILVTGIGAGIAWAISALGWLLLQPLWSNSTAEQGLQNYQAFSLFILTFYGIIAPLLLVVWTTCISRDIFRLRRSLGILGVISACGLVLVFLRGLLWAINILIPINQGYYGAAGLLAVLALPGESLWLIWLFLLGFWLMGRHDASPPTIAEQTGEKE